MPQKTIKSILCEFENMWTNTKDCGKCPYKEECATAVREIEGIYRRKYGKE